MIGSSSPRHILRRLVGIGSRQQDLLPMDCMTDATSEADITLNDDIIGTLVDGFSSSCCN